MAPAGAVVVAPAGACGLPQRRHSAVNSHSCRTWTENEDNALIDLVQAEGSRESDWADKSGRFLGGGVRSKYALRRRWSDLKRKNRDSVGSARKKFSRKTHTFDVVGGRGWVKK